MKESGDETSKSNTKLVPGSVLVRNIIKQRMNNFTLLENLDTGNKIKCRCDFSGLKRRNLSYEFKHTFEGENHENYDIYDIICKVSNESETTPVLYPIVMAQEGDFAYPLAPPMLDCVCPGMVAPCLKYDRDPLVFGEPIFLAKSVKFHISENPKFPQSKMFKYEMMVHAGTKGIKEDVLCQAIIYYISRHHSRNGKPQSYKHIDADLLFYYSDDALFQQNSNALEYILDNEGREDEIFWWEKMNPQLTGSFEKVIDKVYFLQGGKAIRGGIIVPHNLRI